MDSEHNLSIIIPVYNSQGSLPLLIERLKPVLDQTSKAFEVIFINDGSQDRSEEVLSTFAARYSWVKTIHFTRNYGQHNAILCGIRAAQYPVLITMDDDLQHPPEEIPKLLAGLVPGVDMVYGTPLQREHGVWRNLSSRMMKFVLKGLGVHMADKTSAFRAFRTDLRDAFAKFEGPYVSIDVLLAWGTTRFSWVHVVHAPREYSRSHYTLKALIRHSLNMVLGFSTWPLRATACMGFCLAGLGGLILIYVVGRYFLMGYSVPGFPFLASIIAIFSGAQIFSIGILGEYIARIHARTLESPTYTVRLNR